jgi:hypothetical protein
MCNIWTNIAWLSSSSYWSYFQFWKNTTTWSTWNSWRWWDWTSPGWIDSWSALNWWISNDEWLTATWKNQNTTDKTKMQWPCLTWYHIPTFREWAEIIVSWNLVHWDISSSSTRSNDLSNTLKLSLWWRKIYDTWTFNLVWSYWYYWTSSSAYINTTYPSNWGILSLGWLNISPSNYSVFNSYQRSGWMLIRCFKN